jgi:hypothetical protein
MKPPLARHPPEDVLPDYRNASSFFGEIWVKYPLAKHLVCAKLMRPTIALKSTHDRCPALSLSEYMLISLLLQVPTHLGRTFLALIKLRLVMNDIVGKTLWGNDGQNSLGLEQASRYHTMLMGWFHDLPGPLQPQNVAMPTQLLLQ